MLGKQAVGRCADHALLAMKPAEARRYRRAPGAREREAIADERQKRERGDDAAIARGEARAVRIDDRLRDLGPVAEVLDAKSERPLLDAVDRRIVRIAAELGEVRHRTIARRLGVTAPAVIKRVRRMRTKLAAGPLPRLLLTDPAQWRALKALFKAVYGGGDLEEMRDALLLYRGLARSERVDEKLDAPGDRIPPPRCRWCGRFLGRPTTGRPPRWCGDRCRGRSRRSQETAGKVTPASHSK